MTRTLLIVVSWLALAAASAAAAVPAWVAESDALAQDALAVFARYDPENAGQLGVAGVDREIVDLRPDVHQRFVADQLTVAQTLRAKLATVADPRVRQDLEILI